MESSPALQVADVPLIWHLLLQLGGASAVRLRRGRCHQAPQVHTGGPPPPRARGGARWRRWRRQWPGGLQGRHERLHLRSHSPFHVLFFFLLLLLLVWEEERALRHLRSDGESAARCAAGWRVGSWAGSTQPEEGAHPWVDGLSRGRWGRDALQRGDALVPGLLEVHWDDLCGLQRHAGGRRAQTAFPRQMTVLTGW